MRIEALSAYSLHFLLTAYFVIFVGQSCTVQLESLHATQPAVGFWEVQCKTYRFQNMTSDELENYVKKNPIPGVVAPDGNVYITGASSVAIGW